MGDIFSFFSHTRNPSLSSPKPNDTTFKLSMLTPIDIRYCLTEYSVDSTRLYSRLQRGRLAPKRQYIIRGALHRLYGAYNHTPTYCLIDLYILLKSSVYFFINHKMGSRRRSRGSREFFGIRMRGLRRMTTLLPNTQHAVESVRIS